MATSRRKKASVAPADPAQGSAHIHSPDIQKRIAEAAYHQWEREGRPHGRDVEFWVAAEKIVLGNG